MKKLAVVVAIILLSVLFVMVATSCDDPVNPSGGTTQPLPTPTPPGDTTKNPIDKNDLDYTVQYGTDSKQELTISWPSFYEKISTPLYVAFFLGSNGDLDDEYSEENLQYIIDELLTQGNANFAAVKISYRYGTAEYMLKDIYDAVKFVKDNATLLKVDTSKAGMMGYSLGGYLATLYSYKETSPIPIKLTVCQSGFADLTEESFYTFEDDLEETMLDERLELVSDLIGEDITPSEFKNGFLSNPSAKRVKLEELSLKYYYRNNSPEVHFYHGINDNIVNINNIKTFATGKTTKVTVIEFNSGHNDLSSDGGVMQTATDKLSEVVRREFISKS